MGFASIREWPELDQKQAFNNVITTDRLIMANSDVESIDLDPQYQTTGSRWDNGGYHSGFPVDRGNFRNLSAHIQQVVIRSFLYRESPL